MQAELHCCLAHGENWCYGKIKLKLQWEEVATYIYIYIYKRVLIDAFTKYGLLSHTTNIDTKAVFRHLITAFHFLGHLPYLLSTRKDASQARYFANFGCQRILTSILLPRAPRVWTGRSNEWWEYLLKSMFTAVESLKGLGRIHLVKYNLL